MRLFEKTHTEKPQISFDNIFSSEQIGRSLHAIVEEGGTELSLHLIPLQTQDGTLSGLDDIADVIASLRQLPVFLQSPVCRHVKDVTMCSWVITELVKDTRGLAMLKRFGFDVVTDPTDPLVQKNLQRYAASIAYLNNPIGPASHLHTDFGSVPPEKRDIEPTVVRMSDSQMNTLKTVRLQENDARDNAQLWELYKRSLKK